MRWTLLILGVTLAACGMSGGRQEPDRLPPRSQAMPIASAAATPDARLLAFLNVANKGDYEGGRLAQSRATSDAVKTYARQMETDHMRMLEDGERAARTLGIVPAIGPETQPLVRDHEMAMDRLRMANDTDFDRTYMRHEVEMHRRVLQTADAMATQVRDPELKKLVENARPILEAHLHAAEQLSGDIR